ncbi:hypothetical protein BJV82DRAFT_711770 [Fennellomyces sp. T-0311]|nr:hypothetical protein BJV82DRAFT_711770 [Fennellomyces sp. T-0311]
MNTTFYPPAEVIDMGPIQETLQRLSRANGAREYQQAIRHATSAIDQTLTSQLLDLLDNRAYSYAIQGRPDLAITDTQRMIGYSPTKVAGYLRKGMILSLYGYQIQAVEAYDEGIQNAAPDSSRFDNLKIAREAAIDLNETRIDIITKSPVEIANQILSQLPQAAAVNCLSISKAWRERTLCCEQLWRDLSVCGDPASICLFNIMPYFAHHVQHLKVNSTLKGAPSILFEHMKNGLFVKIESLEMSEDSTQNLRKEYATAVSVAFWETRRTLTTLHLDFSSSQDPIKLAEILTACCSVVKLTYVAGYAMSTLVGDFTLLRNDHSLASLQLSLRTITGADIQVLLQRCQQLRRLVMNGCDSTVLNSINLHAPNLEILGYNHKHQIQELQEKVPNSISGLQRIYTHYDGVAIRASQILPLLYKNMATLVEIYSNISVIPQNEFQQFSITYTNLKFQKLNRLTFWCLQGIQELMLRAICGTETLTYLRIGSIYGLQDVANVMMKIPPLTELHISHTYTITYSSSLITLFRKYAKLSETQSSLQIVAFHYCSEITDTVLASLADIKTLRVVTFCKLDNVTGEGINEFFYKVDKGLTSVTLIELDAVTDNHMATVGELKNLQQVKLSKLSYVTVQGVRNVLDGGCHCLKKLTVEGCCVMTEECIQYAKQKVKTVIFS